MGVLGTRPRVVATTAEPPSATPSVLGIPLGVLGTPPGVLGISPEVLGISPEVLGTALGVLGSLAGVLDIPPKVLDTSSPASPPPWMTKCSTTKVLVKPPASPMPRLS